MLEASLVLHKNLPQTKQENKRKVTFWLLLVILALEVTLIW